MLRLPLTLKFIGPEPIEQFITHLLLQLRDFLRNKLLLSLLLDDVMTASVNGVCA